MPGAHELATLVARYGPALVFAVVALQALCVPLPGTTALIAAALYAGSGHRLSIVSVIAAGALGALAGTAGGFALGRVGGERALARLGGLARVGPDRVRAAAALACAQATKLVFFARWITGLRNVAGLVCGAVGVAPARFAAVSALACVAWATSTGLEYYWLGRAIESTSAWLQVAMIALALVWTGASLALVRRRALRLRGASYEGSPSLGEGELADPSAKASSPTADHSGRTPAAPASRCAPCGRTSD